MNYLPAHNVSRPQYLKLSHALGTAAAHVLHQRFGVSQRNIGWSINVEIWKPQPNFQWVTSESKNMDDQWWPMTCWFYVPEPKVKLEECLDFFKTESHLQFAAVLVLWYGPMSDPWPSGNQDLRKEKKQKVLGFQSLLSVQALRCHSRLRIFKPRNMHANRNV